MPDNPTKDFSIPAESAPAVVHRRLLADFLPAEVEYGRVHGQAEHPVAVLAPTPGVPLEPPLPGRSSAGEGRKHLPCLSWIRN